MRNKYDQAQAQDMPIVERVLEVAEHHGVPMAQVALAWHWAKGVTAPIVGCSKPERVDDAIAALNVQLTEDDIAYIEEPYTAHELVGRFPAPAKRPWPAPWRPRSRKQPETKTTCGGICLIYGRFRSPSPRISPIYGR